MIYLCHASRHVRSSSKPNWHRLDRGMEGNIFAHWATICVLKSDAPDLFLGTLSFGDLCELTHGFLKERKAAASDSLFVVLIQGVRIILSLDDIHLQSEAVDFLISLLLSAEFSEPERSIIVQLAKQFVPPLQAFWQGRADLIDFMIHAMESDVNEEMHSVRVLQILVS